MSPGHCPGALKMLWQQNFAIPSQGALHYKDTMPWCHCPFKKKKAYRPTYMQKTLISFTINVNLREVSIGVFAERQQDKCYKDHDGLDEAELQSGLFTEAKEANGIGSAMQTAGTTEPTGGSKEDHNRWKY